MAAHAPRAASAAELATLASFNRTETAFPDDVTLPQLFEAQVARSAARTALICDPEAALGVPSLTYAELNDRANRLAHALRAAGVGPGQVVALMVERGAAMMVGLFGVLKAGGAYLPIAPDAPPERVTYVLKDAGARVLLATSATAGCRDFDGRVIHLDDEASYRGPSRNPLPLGTSRDLAYVIYTSGSTGRPKGVMIEHRSLVNRLHWMQDAYPIGPGDTLLQKTPYTFDVSVWELFWGGLQGATLCLLRPGGEWNPLAILEAIGRHRVSMVHFVPSMLNVFLEYVVEKPSAVTDGLAPVRRVFASGEALTPRHVRRFHEVWGRRTGARLTNLYGPTEATVDVSYFDCPTDQAGDTIPIGRPIHNTRFYVLGDGRQVAIGEVGELCIAGVGLARGYLGNPALTAEAFTDNPARPGERIYRTGDLVRWLPDGNVAFLGRRDHQVKIRGMRIELGEIEHVVMGHPAVRDCVVVVKRYGENLALIVAYIVCRTDVDPVELKRSVRRQLPDYMVPHRFEKIDRVPVTASGKADRRGLLEPAVPAPSA